MAKLKIGDRVTIYRKTKGSVWVPEMHHSVGMSGTILRVNIKYFDIVLDNGKTWWYPKSAVKREVKNEC